MRLKSFTVQKYRSIMTAKRIPVGRKTILVGPNNEGKSNILRALSTAMTLLTWERTAKAPIPRRRVIQFGRHVYDWDTDFPIVLQAKQPNGQTTIILEFQLSTEELEAFRESVGSRLSGTLPLQIAIGQQTAKVTVHKKGPGSAVLSKKSDLIAQFVTDRIDFQQIEAVRTAEAAESVVASMVVRELNQLEDDPGYQAAVRSIEKLQEPILKNLADSINKTLNQFLKDVKSVRIQIPQGEHYRSMRNACQIEVDDGTPTLLKNKGDGAQSLAALGIIRHASESSAHGRNLVIAIEEPESHLHPNAIQELKRVIDELSQRHQVLLTTHNPIFIDRITLANNILVQDNRGKPAASIRQIREILGVRASDNLQCAEMILLVEGEDDRVALQGLLAHCSSLLHDALTHGTLAIDTMLGGSNLAYKIGATRDALCLCHALLDDDKAGRDAFEKARVQGLIDDADVNFCIADGMNESEMEDLYNVELYRTLILNKYRVSIDAPKFRSRKKWSDRMCDCFRQCGKRWDDRVENEVKIAVAQLAASQPEIALNSHHRGSIDALVQSLERRLRDKSQAEG